MIDELRNWSSIALNLITLVGLVKLWLNQGEKQLEKDVSALSGRIEKSEKTLVDHEQRLQAIHNDLKHLPDREMAQKLTLGMAEISGRLGIMEAQLEGRLNAMDERLKPIAATSVRLQEFLIDRAEK